jgi:hypothetical protein
MTDISAPTPTPVPAPAPPHAPSPPTWYAGVEPETVGFWQNKGYPLDDPKAFALKLTEQYRQAEGFIGAPPDQLLKMPKADAKPEDIKAFWQKLGTPADAKEYDFSAIKYGGQPLEEKFVTAMRDSAARNLIPKDKAAAMTADFVKFREAEEAEKTSIEAFAIQSAKDELAKSWGKDLEYNAIVAERAMARIGRAAGLTSEQISVAVLALNKGGVGRAEIMKMFAVAGRGMTEDSYVGSGTTGNGIPTSREGAQAELNSKMADPAWGQRLTSGDAIANAEFQMLTRRISPE